MKEEQLKKNRIFCKFLQNIWFATIVYRKLNSVIWNVTKLCDISH